MSNFRRNASLVSLGIALMAGSAQAQLGVNAGGAPLAAGSTAAEVDLDGTFQASLLRFGSMNTAWKFSANIDIDRVPDGAGGTETGFELSGAVGRRNYSGAGAFRPFIGYGAALGFADAGAVSTFGIGPYFEMGGAYFVTPRFSVGAASRAAMSIQTSDPGDTSIGLSGRLISMMATVYF